MSQGYKHIGPYFHLTEGIVLEIGSGEGSTPLLKHQCAKFQKKFLSIDIAPGRGMVTMAGEEYLASWHNPNLKIGLAYLDNFDYIFPEIEGLAWVEDQRAQYADLSYELNNKNSMVAHLEQSQLVHRLSSDKAVVLLDDTTLDPDSMQFIGKGALAVPWLMDVGWRLIDGVHVTDKPWESFVVLGWNVQ